MGTGKTNFLNGINWCLYGDEPFLSKSSQTLPLLNLNTIKEMKPGDYTKVKVEIYTKTEDRRRMIFSREKSYLIGSGDPIPQDEKIKMIIEDEKGNSNIIEDEEEIKNRVDRSFPKSIRAFFFFDGERLDKYFREAGGETIKGEIFQISRLDLLERIRDRLDKVVREIKSERARELQNTDLQHKLKELDGIKQEFDKKIGEIKEIGKEIEKISDEKSKLEESLREKPDVDKLVGKRDQLESERKEKDELLKEKLEEKNRLLFEVGELMMLYSSINKSLETIKDKREKKEIPPLADPSLLKEILNKQECLICGRKLSENEKERVNKLFIEITSSSELAKILLKMERALENCREKISSFDEKRKSLNRMIDGLDKDINKLQREINDINSKLSSYDIKEIATQWSHLRDLEKLQDEKREKIGSLKFEAEKLQKDIDKLTREIKDMEERIKGVEELRDQSGFGEKAIALLENIKEDIM